MKKTSKWIFSLLALLCAFSIGRGDREYTATDLARAREDAYNDGYHAGYDAGVISERIVLSADQPTISADPSVFETIIPEPSASVDVIDEMPQKGTDSPPVQVTASVQMPATSPQTNTSKPDIPNDVTSTVYVTKSGTKYHKAGCSHLSKSSFEKTLSDVLAAGYTPCKTCKP